MPGGSCSLRDAAADCSNAVHYRLILAQVRGLRFTALMVQGALCRLNCRQRGRETHKAQRKVLRERSWYWTTFVPSKFLLKHVKDIFQCFEPKYNFSGTKEVTQYPGTWRAFKMDFLACISSSRWYPVASSNTPTPLAFLMQCFCWSELGLKHWACVFWHVCLQCQLFHSKTAHKNEQCLFYLPKRIQNET